MNLGINFENSLTITYQGNQISVFYDGRNDYINITEMAIRWRSRKSIRSWMRNQQTQAFLSAWEKKHNPDFLGVHLDTEEIIEDRDDISIKNWIEKTNAIGIFTKVGSNAGTYAHRDIAIKFAAWLDPEFELWLIEKIQELRELENRRNSLDLLTLQEVLYLIKLKEIFKYVAHQNAVESAHKDIHVAISSSKNPFAEFNKWRNDILDISVETINERIKEYLQQNNKILTKSILRKTRNEKILMFDSKESVRNAVWDFLSIKGEVNALSLANFVGDIIRIENGEVIRENIDDLFHSKQKFSDFEDFDKFLDSIPKVKTAREVIEYRRKQIGTKTNSEKEKLSSFNKNLQIALNYNPKNKE